MAGLVDRGGVGDRVELRVQLVDVLDVGGEPVVVERSVMREGKGGAAEVGERKVEGVLELTLGFGRPGLRAFPGLGCGVPA